VLKKEDDVGLEKNVCAKTNKEIRTRMKLAALFGATFLAIGVLLGSIGFKTVVRGLESVRWPHAEGLITLSEIEHHRSTTTSGGIATFTKRPNIHYNYQVGGVAYQGKRIYFISNGTGSAWVSTKLKRYPKNSRARVYYNPSNPSESVLEPGVSAGSVTLFGGFIFIACAIGAVSLKGSLSDFLELRRGSRIQRI